jgi:NhaP-type Na+/H+ or K+/H+ antiporter
VQQFVATIALIGIVIVVASLLSSIIERVGIPLVGAFLLLGAALGPYGFRWIDVGLESPRLAVLATLALTLVLFSDAVGVNLKEVRERARLAWVILGPGTILPAALIALAAYALLGVPAAGAAILGAALASTDPVLLRTILRAPGRPATTRVALRLESGMNDVVLLPIVVISILALRPVAPTGMELGKHLVGLFVLGPVLGAAIGWVGIMMLASVRARVGVRRDYESLYALGLGFSAYAAAEAVGGSGFLAAFAAGLAIASLDVELCDCFLEYGEATAEMLLLLTFVAFGTSLIWTGLRVIDLRTIAFAIVALAARTAVLYPVLGWIDVRGRDRTLIAWFGPRGLSSLLLVLLPVLAKVPGSERWFTITALVVLLSLVAHGGIIGWYVRVGQRHRSRLPLAGVAAGVSPEAASEVVTIADARRMQESGEPVVFVDARAERNLRDEDRMIPGSVRVDPEDAVRSATEQLLAKHATLVVYCA